MHGPARPLEEMRDSARTAHDKLNHLMETLAQQQEASDTIGRHRSFDCHQRTNSAAASQSANAALTLHEAVRTLSSQLARFGFKRHAHNPQALLCELCCTPIVSVVTHLARVASLSLPSHAKQPLTASDAILSGLVPGKNSVMISRCFYLILLIMVFLLNFLAPLGVCAADSACLLHETVLTWFYNSVFLRFLFCKSRVQP